MSAGNRNRRIIWEKRFNRGDRKKTRKPPSAEYKRCNHVPERSGDRDQRDPEVQREACSKHTKSMK
jgi:hypothetical protein